MSWTEVTRWRPCAEAAIRWILRLLRERRHAEPSRASLVQQLATVLQSLIVVSPDVSSISAIRACSGSLVGIFVVGWVTRAVLGPNADLALLVPPMGATTVLLFAWPKGPFSGPWSVLGGHTISALVGIVCAQWIADSILASAAAVAGALGAMLALRCVHPPSCSVALMAVVGGPTVTGAGYGFAFSPILVTSLLLLTIAWLFNFATRQHNWHRSAGKLAKLPEEALTSHIQNHGAIRCHDVMSHEPSVIDIACDLDAAWVSLRSRGVLSLPVVDKRTGHFVGLITVEDCVKRYKSIAPDQSRFDQRCTAAALVRTGVNPVTADTSVIDLVQALSEYGPYPVPVVDAAGRLIGTVTHSDLTTAILFANYVANYEKAGTT